MCTHFFTSLERHVGPLEEIDPPAKLMAMPNSVALNLAVPRAMNPLRKRFSAVTENCFDAGTTIALVSEAGSFLKAHGLLYHAIQGSRARSRTCIESNKEEEGIIFNRRFQEPQRASGGVGSFLKLQGSLPCCIQLEIELCALIKLDY